MVYFDCEFIPLYCQSSTILCVLHFVVYFGCEFIPLHVSSLCVWFHHAQKCMLNNNCVYSLVWPPSQSATELMHCTNFYHSQIIIMLEKLLCSIIATILFLCILQVAQSTDEKSYYQLQLNVYKSCSLLDSFLLLCVWHFPFTALVARYVIHTYIVNHNYNYCALMVIYC